MAFYAHQVQSGDSAASIAQRYTGNPSREHDLVMSNAHKPVQRIGGKIYFQNLAVGEKLNLPPSWFEKTHQLYPPSGVYALAPTSWGGTYVRIYPDSCSVSTGGWRATTSAWLTQMQAVILANPQSYRMASDGNYFYIWGSRIDQAYANIFRFPVNGGTIEGCFLRYIPVPGVSGLPIGVGQPVDCAETPDDPACQGTTPTPTQYVEPKPDCGWAGEAYLGSDNQWHCPQTPGCTAGQVRDVNGNCVGAGVKRGQCATNEAYDPIRDRCFPNPGKLTDSDCADNELLDAVTGRCASICPDGSRQVNGKCTNLNVPVPPKPPTTCPDGSTAPAGQPCPDQVTKCPNGQTVKAGTPCPVGGKATNWVPWLVAGVAVVAGTGIVIYAQQQKKKKALGGRPTLPASENPYGMRRYY